MTIKYNDINFDVVDNGDGTFTLTPQTPVSAASLLAEYRAVREEAKRVVAYKQKLQGQLVVRNARLLELRAQRDALKAMLETAGEEPDADETVEE